MWHLSRGAVRMNLRTPDAFDGWVALQAYTLICFAHECLWSENEVIAGLEVFGVPPSSAPSLSSGTWWGRIIHGKHTNYSPSPPPRMRAVNYTAATLTSLLFKSSTDGNRFFPAHTLELIQRRVPAPCWAGSICFITNRFTAFQILSGESGEREGGVDILQGKQRKSSAPINTSLSQPTLPCFTLAHCWEMLSLHWRPGGGVQIITEISILYDSKRFWSKIDSLINRSITWPNDLCGCLIISTVLLYHQDPVWITFGWCYGWMQTKSCVELFQRWERRWWHRFGCLWGGCEVLWQHHKPCHSPSM